VIGLLLVDKPVGMTSHDVVDLVRRKLGTRTIGHVGTLDPGASGLLVLAVGAATRCVAVWQTGDKTYEGTIQFGVVTDSQDLMGRVLEERPVTVDEAAIRDAARGMLGEIAQTPPMVSAVKVGGERLYNLARRGIEVERAARTVTVHEWEWPGFELPRARFRIRCGKGTYVRTLAHDLGQHLGCGAALASLRRTRSEPFDVTRAIPAGEMRTLTAEEVWARAGIALEQALTVLPWVNVDEAAAFEIGFGRPVPISSQDRGRAPIAGGPRSIVIASLDGQPLALGELQKSEGGEPDEASELFAQPQAVFPWAVRSGRRDVA
jgi:tRNA pseudouridine55 synthase